MVTSPKLANALDIEDIWTEAVRTANRKLSLYNDPVFPERLTCPFSLNALLDSAFDPAIAVEHLRGVHGDTPHGDTPHRDGR